MKSEKISSKELFNAIDQIYQEKGITSEYLIDSLKSALKIAYKRDFINTYSADEREERKNSREDELVKPEGSEEKKVTKNGYLIPQDIDIDIVDNLQPIQYELVQSNDNKIHYGFIAQDVEKLLSDAGLNPELTGIIGQIQNNGQQEYVLTYTEFIPLLTKKCQELQAEINILKEEISELKSNTT